MTCCSSATDLNSSFLVSPFPFSEWPHLISVIVMSEDVAALIIPWILESFPSQLDTFIFSLHQNLLVRLSDYLWGFQLIPKETHYAVGTSQPCIRALYDVLTNEEGFNLSKSSSKRKQKRGPNTVLTNTKVFRDVGAKAPSSRKEAVSLAEEILQNQKCILQVGTNRLPRF